MFAVGLLVAVLGALFTSLAPNASADTEADVSPITSYATYPEASLIPDTCNATGAGVLTGINYKVERAGEADQNVSDIGSVALVAGDKVTMSWADYTAGCENIGISLSVKQTTMTTFSLADHQVLYNFVYCSGSDCGTGTSKGNLTIEIPSPPILCNFQFDAAIGPPLQEVGPDGSYYNNVSRTNATNQGLMNHPINTGGANMLIGGSNGGQGICEAPTASATQSCTTASGPAVALAITNPDDDRTAVVDVAKDGTVTDAAVNVPAGSGVGNVPAVVVTIPFAVNETATITATDPQFGEFFSDEFTFDCVNPNATIADNCAEGGVVISFTNTGESDTDFTVTKGGVVIDTVSVDAGDTESRTYAMNEDDKATFRVTSVGYDSGDVAIDHDCIEVEGSTTTTVPTTEDTVQGVELARTGTNATSNYTILSGALLILGGLLMALANRPLPATASSSRGR